MSLLRKEPEFSGSRAILKAYRRIRESHQEGDRWIYRVLLALFAACLCDLAAASGPVFGTKKDPIVAPVAGSPGLGTGPFIQMMVALLIVLGLVKYVLPKVAGKVGKKLSTQGNGGIRIEEDATFAGGHLYVVTARSKTLLLSVAASGVTCLADLTEARMISDPEKPVFMDYLDQEEHQPSHLFVDAQGEPTCYARDMLSEDEIHEALDRLNRLGP